MSATERKRPSAEVAHGRLPPGRGLAEPFCQNRQQDPRLLLAVSGQRLEPVDHGVCRTGALPNSFGIAVVVLDEVFAECLGSLRHVRRIAMQRWSFAKGRLELFQWRRGDGLG